ncbi:hypothetical protein D6_00312 [Faustovirus]|nr:hypothetical protein D6_00312 [Faustovirus]
MEPCTSSCIIIIVIFAILATFAGALIALGIIFCIKRKRRMLIRRVLDMTHEFAHPTAIMTDKHVQVVDL